MEFYGTQDLPLIRLKNQKIDEIKKKFQEALLYVHIQNYSMRMNKWISQIYLNL